jgi:hypothetical protein
MLHDPVPDTWLWCACRALALALSSDNDAPAKLAAHLAPAPLRFAHGVSALALIIMLVAPRDLGIVFTAGVVHGELCQESELSG